jgi:hypothetical protein
MKFGESSSSKEDAFDDLAIALASQSHGPADRKKYAPTDFSNWVLTKITASERIGIVLKCLLCFDASLLNQSHL